MWKDQGRVPFSPYFIHIYGPIYMDRTPKHVLLMAGNKINRGNPVWFFFRSQARRHAADDFNRVGTQHVVKKHTRPRALRGILMCVGTLPARDVVKKSTINMFQATRYAIIIRIIVAEDVWIVNALVGKPGKDWWEKLCGCWLTETILLKGLGHTRRWKK